VSSGRMGNSINQAVYRSQARLGREWGSTDVVDVGQRLYRYEGREERR